jgi:predicted Zn-ribbon and HTH transcriptional regulator
MAFYRHTCCRCGISWNSRLEDPKQCPTCKQTKWSIPARTKKQAPIKELVLQKMCECKKCGMVWVPKVENPVSCPYCKSNSWDKKPTKKPSQKKRFHLVKVKESTIHPLMARFYVGGGYTKMGEKAKLYSKDGAKRARLVGGVPWFEELFLVPAAGIKKLIRPDGMVPRSALLQYYMSSINADLKSRNKQQPVEEE